MAAAFPALEQPMRGLFFIYVYERSFPGYFTKKNPSGKRKFMSLKTSGGTNTKPWRPFSFYIYLLNLNAQTTPNSTEEFELTQAGLGKRHVTMSKDMTHEELFRMLQQEYPKMQGLKGGWLLYKTAGGQGKRKLIMIPPDSEGYTASLIRSVTGGGKNVLYIVPLQQEFDLTPLPPDSVEFINMPKAECQTCKVSFPLQILALHIQECIDPQVASDSSETTEVQLVSVTAPLVHHDAGISVNEENVPCPICFREFTPQSLQMHASTCGERKEDPESPVATVINLCGAEKQIKCLDDVLDTICQRVDTEKQFNIHISRTNILERGLLQWQRQKRNSPASKETVTFFGEAGVDTGAIRKEFLTEMIAGIEHRFFEGSGHQKSPRYSLTDLDSGFYRTAGEIFAASLAQGGPAPSFLSLWTYDYLCRGQIDLRTLKKEDVADAQLTMLIEQVESSTENSLGALSEEILNCGYTGSIMYQNKESIVRAIILHGVLRLQPMLDQVREGLQLYNLLSFMEHYPKICQPLFVAMEERKVDAEFIMASITPQLSEKGTTRHQLELEIMNFMQDFLHEAEEGRCEAEGDIPSSISPAKFLQWITGQGHIPILPSEKRDFSVILKFNHDCGANFGHHDVCFPVISACANTITLPVIHMTSYNEFKGILIEAFCQGQEFNTV